MAEAATVGDDRVRFLPEIIAACEQVAALVARAVEQGCLPLVLGGDHSVALGTLGGLAARSGPGGVLWIDAHGDLNRPQTTPSGNVHGMPLAAALGLAGAEVRERRPGRFPPSLRSGWRSSALARSTTASVPCSTGSAYASSR